MSGFCVRFLAVKWVFFSARDFFFFYWIFDENW